MPKPPSSIIDPDAQDTASEPGAVWFAALSGEVSVEEAQRRQQGRESDEEIAVKAAIVAPPDAARMEAVTREVMKRLEIADPGPLQYVDPPNVVRLAGRSRRRVWVMAGLGAVAVAAAVLLLIRQGEEVVYPPRADRVALRQRSTGAPSLEVEVSGGNRRDLGDTKGTWRRFVPGESFRLDVSGRPGERIEPGQLEVLWSGPSFESFERKLDCDGAQEGDKLVLRCVLPGDGKGEGELLLCRSTSAPCEVHATFDLEVSGR